MKKLSFLTAFLFCAYAQKVEMSKKYIDLGLGLTSVYGSVTPYSSFGPHTPPDGYTKEFYTYRFSTLRTGSKSSSFRPNSSLSAGCDFKVNKTPVMIGVFGGAGYGGATFQASYDGDLYKLSNASSSAADLTGTSTLRRLDLSVNSLAADNVASTALTSTGASANNGDIKTIVDTVFATIDSGKVTGGITGVATKVIGKTTGSEEITSSNGIFATDGSGGSITGTNAAMASLAQLTLTAEANEFATIAPATGVTDNMTGNLKTASIAVPMATISKLESDVALNAVNNVAKTELDITDNKSGVADLSLTSSASSNANAKIIREKLFVTFRQKANINGGFRIGVPKGDFFPHLRLGYSLLLMSAEIKRANPDTLELEVYKVSKAVSALSVGVGVDFQVTSRFAVGATFDCSFGQNARFDFAKKNILSEPGKIDNKLAVKFRPTVSTFMVTGKFVFPANRPSV